MRKSWRLSDALDALKIQVTGGRMKPTYLMEIDAKVNYPINEVRRGSPTMAAKLDITASSAVAGEQIVED